MVLPGQVIPFLMVDETAFGLTTLLGLVALIPLTPVGVGTAQPVRSDAGISGVFSSIVLVHTYRGTQNSEM